MTLKEFAYNLNGRFVFNELTTQDIQIAKENDFLIVYSHLDNYVEVDGIYKNTFRVWDNTSLYYRPITKTVHKIEHYGGSDIKIDCLYGDLDKGIRRLFRTSVPHETFMTYEPIKSIIFNDNALELFDRDSTSKGDIYCQGIVIDTKPFNF